jgi:hypothetical protein
MSQSDSREMAESSVEQYCSISEAMKLVSVPFDGDRRKLKEFIDNVNTAFELVKPEQHSLLLKFVKTRITGDAKSKLLVRDLSSTWREVKQILEENYGVKRTLDYYACRMFSSRQGNNESIASWSSRIDTMQSELREAAFRICEEVEVIGAMGLINHLAKACFVQGLVNERIQTIVRAKGESVALSVCIDAALEEESAILSVKERGFAPQKFNKGPEIAGEATGSNGNMNKESGRGFGFANRGLNRGMARPGRGTGADVRNSTGTDVREGTGIATHVVRKAADSRIICYACGKRGHIKRMCRNANGNAVRRNNPEH